MGECFECRFEGEQCPNNIYSKNDLANNHKRCSPNTEFCNTNDKFQPKQKSIKRYFESEDEKFLKRLPFLEKV